MGNADADFFRACLFDHGKLQLRTASLVRDQGAENVAFCVPDVFSDRQGDETGRDQRPHDLCNAGRRQRYIRSSCDHAIHFGRQRPVYGCDVERKIRFDAPVCLPFLCSDLLFCTSDAAAAGEKTCLFGLVLYCGDALFEFIGRERAYVDRVPPDRNRTCRFFYTLYNKKIVFCRGPVRRSDRVSDVGSGGRYSDDDI